jgi:hypothetical protein
MLIKSSPKKIKRSAPEHKNGANGKASRRPAPVHIMHAIPTIEPTSDAKKSVIGIAGQPKNAPIIASSLMSPPPIPSTPVSFS